MTDATRLGQEVSNLIYLLNTYLKNKSKNLSHKKGLECRIQMGTHGFHLISLNVVAVISVLKGLTLKYIVFGGVCYDTFGVSNVQRFFLKYQMN